MRCLTLQGVNLVYKVQLYPYMEAVHFAVHVVTIAQKTLLRPVD